MDISRRAKAMPASPIRRLAPYADAAKARGIRVFHLNIGQPDIATPPEMADAIRDHADPVLAYGPSAGLPAARQAVADYLTGLGTPVAASNVLITQGGSEAIAFAISAICDPGDEIVVFEPFYTNYSGFACMAGITLRPVATSVENGYRPPSPADISAAIGPRTRAILYCSPANPTGTVLRRDEIRAIFELAARHDLFVIADEAYREFTYDGIPFTGVLDVAAETDNLRRTILIDSISKRFSACGARIGYLVAMDPAILDVCLRFGQARLCPPTLEQIGAIRAFQAIGRFVPTMIAEYQRRRDRVMAGLGAIEGAVCARPEGAFYVMPRLPVDDADAFATFLLTDFAHEGQTVMVAPGNGFYATPGKGKDEIRIAYVLKEDDLAVAMDLLHRGLAAYRRQG